MRTPAHASLGNPAELGHGPVGVNPKQCVQRVRGRLLGVLGAACRAAGAMPQPACSMPRPNWDTLPPPFDSGSICACSRVGVAGSSEVW